METIRFKERKKSYKLEFILLSVFLLCGAGLIVFAVTHEPEPTVIGKNNSENSIYSNEYDYLKNDEVSIYKNEHVVISNKTVSDKTIKAIKADLSLPTITIAGKVLEELNTTIYNQFQATYQQYKSTMSDAGNNFTYKVSYERMDNTVASTDIISIVIYERLVDDKTKKNVSEKKYTYTIEVKSSKVLDQQEIANLVLGTDYKMVISGGIKDYVIQNKLIKEIEYAYATTQMEEFYVKENKFHMVFNPGELADKSKGIIDISF